MRISEKALILPALYFIKQYGQATTSDLICELTALFSPTGEDAKILEGRNDTKFSQKVRNLKSHRDTNKMDLYTTFIDNTYELTDCSKKFLSENQQQIETLIANGFKAESLATAFEQQVSIPETILHNSFIYPEDTIIAEGQQSVTNNISRKRSQKLRKAAINYYKSQNDGKLRCCVCGFCFDEHYTDIGNDFIEIHHEHPISQLSDEEFDKHLSDALANVKPVCSNCHRMLHRDSKKLLSIEELKTLLK